MTNENWPVEYADQLIVGDVTSNVAICCLWSSKDRFQSTLVSMKFNVIGNLYSRAGLNPMLRNILANPSIRYLVLAGKSLTDSDSAILDFFRRGVDEDWRVIVNGAQLDTDIPVKALNDVRKGVELIDLRNSPNPQVELHDLIKRLRPLPPFSKPRQFPKSPRTIKTFPSEISGFIVRQKTIYEVWIEIIRTIMTFGHTSPTDYGLEQKEILNLLSVIEKPQSYFDSIPDWSPFTSEDVENYVCNFLNAENREGGAYNYGFRLRSHWRKDQLENIVADLQRSSHSRRAVASLWDPREDSSSSNPVCLTTIQAVIRQRKLHLMANIRSNDMFRAYPLNAVALAALQVYLARELEEVEIGPLEITSISAHIYSDCWALCEPALVDALRRTRKFERDDRGSFVFRTEDNQLVADHYSQVGDLVQTFKTRSASELSELITPFVGRVDHALYLGREIARLAYAVDNGRPYQQDRVSKDS